MRAWCAGLLLASLGCVSSFYLPGLAPVTYCDNSEIQGCTSDIRLFVNKLDSEETVMNITSKCARRAKICTI